MIQKFYKLLLFWNKQFSNIQTTRSFEKQPIKIWLAYILGSGSLPVTPTTPRWPRRASFGTSWSKNRWKKPRQRSRSTKRRFLSCATPFKTASSSAAASSRETRPKASTCSPNESAPFTRPSTCPRVRCTTPRRTLRTGRSQGPSCRWARRWWIKSLQQFFCFIKLKF